ncbi:MAG TPA: hypothetical protein VF221_21205 [Chloroflexota bacterium]
MFRTLRARGLRPLLAAFLLVGVVIVPIGATSARASIGPKVSLRCEIVSTRTSVTCWIWGSSFAGGESVHLTYRVAYLTMPKVNGKHPQRVLHGNNRTDANGSFPKPAVVTFPLPKKHDTFAIYVTALGAQRDKGTTSTALIDH